MADGWAALQAIGDAAGDTREKVSPLQYLSAMQDSGRGWQSLATMFPQDPAAAGQLMDYARALPQPQQGPSFLDKLGTTTLGKMAQDAWSAVKAPGDAYAGRLQVIDPTTGRVSDEAIKRGFDLGGLVMSGGFGGAPGGATLGSGPVRKEAANTLGSLGNGLIVPNKTVWSDLSKKKHPIPVEDMRAVREVTGELLPRQTISPETLQGSILTPAVGDRTAAGAVLKQVNDTPLSFPVSLEGGPDFMRAAANQHDGSVWASDKGVITRLAKHTQALGDTGKDVNLVYSAMGARSGDYSHMMADALLAQLENSKITKKAVREFDQSMAAQGLKWPGLRNPDLREALLSSGPMRKAMVEEMALATHQAASFPEIGSTRFAISEPSMVGQPTGASGYAISRLDPAGKVISAPAVPHTTYNTQLGGTGYLGGLEQQVPREVMFPDFFAARRNAGQPKLADDRAFSMSNVSQHADQQWLDNIMRHLEGRR